MKSKTYPIEVNLVRTKEDELTFSEGAIEEWFDAIPAFIRQALLDAYEKDKIHIMRELKFKALLTVSGEEE